MATGTRCSKLQLTSLRNAFMTICGAVMAGQGLYGVLEGLRICLSHEPGRVLLPGLSLRWANGCFRGEYFPWFPALLAVLGSL